ncbi:hypothetical protein [Caballeronia sp. DA-9]|uniref:hypothetical protein n=1 Tax=Caballeronia sp. DA-9 TaxID=3436237 RepID=UPI003F663D70
MSELKDDSNKWDLSATEDDAPEKEIEIALRNGKKCSVLIAEFNAIEGWEIGKHLILFNQSGASTDDVKFRHAFLVRVLSFASVKVGGATVPLSSAALIDEKLERWTNVEKVFNAVLSANGLDVDSAALQSEVWERAGEKIAASFISAATSLMGPLLDLKARVEPEQVQNAQQPE